ncbi:exocyst complex component 3 isoform X2 [Leguminivora glycinivorella]|uniref:exocyst complex component 3 isoform X1 n=1 Tax=Leguminivora glycinivorella TaxID=1035111 RepID=UPI00200DBEDD|nr:exocyst complex component 3 isoform X1 [Leguminivora glycinivorella]XP_047989705.1 exocyst complex component 3 isoform X2 [Leguminivora glycinivorella]
MSLSLATMDEIEEEAKAAAEKMVINMMQRPGQLEKVEQYKKRITHKKASIEAQLKSAVQGKLDGVSVGLKQLQECLDDVQQISVKMDELEELLKGVPPLVASLQAVREEDSRHSQYVTAMDSLKHIFTVPDSVAKAMQWIGEGKLLHAHQCLNDLENSRDDLLYELHRLPNQSSHDKIMLKAYFEDVEMVSNSLEKQIKLILARTLNTVRKEPTVIVTALRIIEREEKRDKMALEQQNQTGFMPPGRPKNWRTVAFEELERAVAQRTEGTRVDEREDNKLWLVKYLELTRQLILEDLRVVKTLCVPCFPPHYDIVNKYVNMYHTCLSSSLQGVVDSGLEGNEYVTLLSWVLNTYPGTELMGSPELNIDVSTLPPLLSEESLQDLCDEYLQKMESNYMEWMEKTLESERAEWNGDRAPEVEPHSNAYHTHAPVIIFQMIDQNLQVTQTISKEITFKALMLSIEQVTRYGNMYREGVLQFKNTHFSDRSRCAYFTHHMITIVNNSEQMVRLAQQTQARHWPPGRHDAPAERKFDTLLDTFQKLRDEAARFLLDEAFLDLEVHFDDLFSSKWLPSSIPVDTICVTLEDYFQDYNHLREKNFEYVINEAQNLVYKKYITAMLSKKVTFKTVEEAQQAATKIVKEANQIRSFFRRIGAEGVNVDWPFEVISSLAEVLRCQDIEMLSLDLHGVLDKCPNMTEEQLVRLLSLRGDVPRAHVRETASHVLSTRAKPRASTMHDFFKDITFSDRLLERFTL